MNYTSCPTGVVNAPIGVVWTLLMNPGGWGAFYNVRITAVDPTGHAVVGQTVFAEAGPPFLRLKLQFRFVGIDPLRHQLGLEARFPFGLTVRENLTCDSLGEKQCRVNYNCGFGFPTGWRGAVMQFLMRRRLDAGPADSLNRLRREAERLYSLD